MALLIFFAILAVVAVRVATPQEWNRARETGAALAGEARRAAALNRLGCQPFYETLRAQRKVVVLAPTMVGIQAVFLLWMIVSRGTPGDPRALVSYGASFGPRTTNGEWWRLISASFIHAGLVSMLVNGAALLQLGLMLERLVGRVTLAVVLLSAGLFASLTALSESPMAVTSGAAGTVFGLCGLLCAASVGHWWRQSELLVPRVVLKRLAPITAVFVLYNLANADLPALAELSGFVSGLVCGFVLVYGVGDEGPSPRRMGASMAATVLVAAAAAVPLRGVTDVRPEIERLIAMEERTAAIYRTEAARLTKRQTSTDAVARVIQDRILTELYTARERLTAINGVPAEDRPLADAAIEYLRLREQSWTLRAESLRATSRSDAAASKTIAGATHSRRQTEQLHQANHVRLGNAEMAERAAHETLERLKRLE